MSSYLAAAGALLLIAALDGCHDSGSNSDPGPSPELTTSIAVLTRDEALAALDALTLPSLLAPLGAGTDS
ncbi:MAG: hypothetical protein H0U55_17160, partial [Rubrobacteraceae bacterium]|nr:hypothetical protein [Rubrobacteraceae bacterium]